MRTQDDKGFLGTLESSTQVIMSEGLDLDLGVPKDISQLLCLGDSRYICNVKRIKASRDAGEMAWEFDVEAPGLNFVDLLGSDNISLEYDDERFALSDEYEINLPDVTSTLITFRGRRIVNNHE